MVFHIYSKCVLIFVCMLQAGYGQTHLNFIAVRSSEYTPLKQKGKEIVATLVFASA